LGVMGQEPPVLAGVVGVAAEVAASFAPT